jgi:predicted dehydrogenase
MTMQRRRFLTQSTKGVVGLSAMMSASRATRVLGANDKVRIGLIGCGGRGLGLLRTYARDKRFEFAAMSDPDARRGQREFELIRSEQNPGLKRLVDFRDMLDDKSIDLIMIATPDHWHAPAMIYACEAGKDVYVEKPMSHNIAEGRMMVDAAMKHKRVVQVGMQSRSAPYLFKAKEYIQSGKLGSIHLCKVFNLKADKPYKADRQNTPPKDVDINLWLGPAREKYAYVYQNKGWLYHWDFCNGDMMNDGVHQTDVARWLIGKTYPTSIHCSGGNYAFDDDREVPDTQVATLDFGDLIMIMENAQYTSYMAKTPMALRESDAFPYWPQNSTRIELYGSDGLMIIGRHGGGWQVFSKDGEVVAQAFGRFPDEVHKDNLYTCLHSREPPNASVVEGHLSCLLVHAACISLRLGGRRLLFDAESERFNDAEANGMLKREYRKGFAI